MTKSRTRIRSEARKAKAARPFYREGVSQTWRNMGIKGRVALCGSVLAFLVLVSQASGILKGTYHAVRPYADRATEIVLAGWQYDRAVAELRDVNEQIRRLEQKKKVLAAPTRQHPRGQDLSKDDRYFLSVLYRDKDTITKALKYIDTTQRPYAK